MKFLSNWLMYFVLGCTLHYGSGVEVMSLGYWAVLAIAGAMNVYGWIEGFGQGKRDGFRQGADAYEAALTARIEANRRSADANGGG